jgi:hypothetical protein
MRTTGIQKSNFRWDCLISSHARNDTQTDRSFGVGSPVKGCRFDWDDEPHTHSLVAIPQPSDQRT